MAEDGGGGELASVDHGPLNEGPWEKRVKNMKTSIKWIFSAKPSFILFIRIF